MGPLFRPTMDVGPQRDCNLPSRTCSESGLPVSERTPSPPSGRDWGLLTGETQDRHSTLSLMSLDPGPCWVERGLGHRT